MNIIEALDIVTKHNAVDRVWRLKYITRPTFTWMPARRKDMHFFMFDFRLACYGASPGNEPYLIKTNDDGGFKLCGIDLLANDWSIYEHSRSV